MQCDWVEIFSDGSCGGKIRAGGYGCLIRYSNVESRYSGWACTTTNNRMELAGAIEGLKAIKSPSKVYVYTDSQYVYHGATGRLKRSKNMDVWRELDKAVLRHLQVEWAWVRGHVGIEGNEVADYLAGEARLQAKNYLEECPNICCGSRYCLKGDHVIA